MKVEITKYTRRAGEKVTYMDVIICLDGVKPYDLTDDEWEVVQPFVDKIVRGTATFGNTTYGDSRYTLEKKSNWEAGIFAESENYYIRFSFERVNLYRKPDSKHIACVGDFYGNPMDVYIDPKERFCISIGCGIIKYNLCEPFEEYAYDKITPQWIEVGREGEDEWCDHIDEVTEDYIAVSFKEKDTMKFDINTLEPME